MTRSELELAENLAGAKYPEQYVLAAHVDYSRPLDIRWLCRPCHRVWDLNEPKSGRAAA